MADPKGVNRTLRTRINRSYGLIRVLPKNPQKNTCATSKIKHQNCVKIDADYTIRCRMYMIKAMAVPIWSETGQNTHFLNRRSKTLKKTRARRQKKSKFHKNRRRLNRSMQNYITKGMAAFIRPETYQNEHFLKILVFPFFDKILTSWLSRLQPGPANARGA